MHSKVSLVKILMLVSVVLGGGASFTDIKAATIRPITDWTTNNRPTLNWAVFGGFITVIHGSIPDGTVNGVSTYSGRIVERSLECDPEDCVFAENIILDADNAPLTAYFLDDFLYWRVPWCAWRRVPCREGRA